MKLKSFLIITLLLVCSAFAMPNDSGAVTEPPVGGDPVGHFEEVCVTTEIPGYWTSNCYYLADSITRVCDSADKWVEAREVTSCHYVWVSDSNSNIGDIVVVNSNEWSGGDSGLPYTTTVADSASNTAITIAAEIPVEGTITVVDTSVSVPVSNRSGVKTVTVDLSPSLDSAMGYAVLVMNYSDEDIEDIDENSLSIYYLNGGSWDSVGGTVDCVNNRIYALVTHFSTYGVFGTTKTAGVKSPVAGVVKSGFTAFSSSMLNGNIQISLSLPNSSSLQMNVYDIRGNLVKNLANGEYGSGLHTVTWNGMNESNRQVSSGLYFVCMISGQQKQMLKVLR
jgi:hypothetical protein